MMQIEAAVMGGLPLQRLIRWMVGFGAAALSLYFLLQHRAELPIVAASMFFLLICITDTLTTRIPNVLTGGLVVVGLIINTIQDGLFGMAHSLLGLAFGIGLLIIPYAMGGFGAGDVKALGALGALTGPIALLYIFVYMAFYGGILAALHYIFNSNFILKIREGWSNAKAFVLSKDISHLKPPEKKEPMRFPYAAAIAFGYYTYLVYGAISI